jgi:hypothetical protein
VRDEALRSDRRTAPAGGYCRRRFSALRFVLPSETFRYPRKSTIAPTAIVIHMKVSPAIFPTSSVFPFPVTTEGIIRERWRDHL